MRLTWVRHSRLRGKWCSGRRRFSSCWCHSLSLYYFAPNVEQRKWYWVTPGAVLGVFLWLVASIGFKIYLHFFNSYSATYGSLGAMIILLTWLYVSGASILIGGEINSEIEHAAAEHGDKEAKAEGEKVPQGEKGSAMRHAERRPAA